MENKKRYWFVVFKYATSRGSGNDVLEIRASKLTPTEISNLYNVNLPAIYKILARKRWRHI